jgi:hypothetical protein
MSDQGVSRPRVRVRRRSDRVFEPLRGHRCQYADHPLQVWPSAQGCARTGSRFGEVAPCETAIAWLSPVLALEPKENLMAYTKLNALERLDRDSFKQLFLETLDDPDVPEKVRQIVGETP